MEIEFSAGYNREDCISAFINLFRFSLTFWGILGLKKATFYQKHLDTQPKPNNYNIFKIL